MQGELAYSKNNGHAVRTLTNGQEETVGITQLILDDHHEQRRLFAILEQISRADTETFFFLAEDGIRFKLVTGVQTCALPISRRSRWRCSTLTGSKPSTTATATTPA